MDFLTHAYFLVLIVLLVTHTGDFHSDSHLSDHDWVSLAPSPSLGHVHLSPEKKNPIYLFIMFSDGHQTQAAHN